MAHRETDLCGSRAASTGPGSRLAAFFADRSGNFGLAFAVLLVPLLLALGVAFDYARIYNIQSKMQADLDTALLSAVGHMTTVDEDSLKAEIQRTFGATTNLGTGYVLQTTDITIDPATSVIQAKVSSSVPMTFMGLAGITSMPINAVSSVQGGQDEIKNSLSLYMVLDRSGSMASATKSQYQGTCYNKKGKPYACTKYFSKMESLIMAAGSLLDQFDVSDPDQTYVRTGAVSYNSDMQTPQPLAFGTAAVRTYVNALTANGGTDSSLAFQTAYESLMNSAENQAHLDKSGQVPVKYIVFMTDGDNNKTSSDVTTKMWCDRAKADKIEVFTVAFMAPSRGQALLSYCATDAAHYFEADDTADLVAAFTAIGKTTAKRLVRLTN